MLATATHDHKRGEDVRARLFAISEVAGEWIDISARWREAWPDIDDVDEGDLAMLLQAIVGAWPESGDARPAFADRLGGYAVKTVREAKLRSSWTAPDESYERAVLRAVEALVLGERAAPLRAEIIAFLDTIRPIERVKSLAQTFLRLTCPGVPDTYQGTELADRSLVDPDNRRPVDYAARERMIGQAGAKKFRLVRDCLRVRAQRPDVFAGGYERIPLDPDCIAFERGEGAGRLLMVTALRPRAGKPADWVRGLVNTGARSLLAPDVPCAIFAR
jgi:(1->4)-alpha-D-glucan 1-alpha-D-glucosylmutase